MERLILLASSFCFLLAVVRTGLLIRAGVFRPGRSGFFAIASGFVLQTAFLWIRGSALGRCPLTNLFEVFIFMAWSVALIYMLVGPAYRLSLMGAFTAPLVLLMQTFALLAPIDRPRAEKISVNPWLEFHASMSIVAYGAFALACVAGLMYLLQERQLKTHQLHSVFHHLPPLTDLFAAITRLLWIGFGLYTAGLVSGFFTGEPSPLRWPALLRRLSSSAPVLPFRPRPSNRGRKRRGKGAAHSRPIRSDRRRRNHPPPRQD